MFYGKGYNEKVEGEKYYKTTENGKTTRCYNTWANMLERCYSAKYQAKHPTYIGTIAYYEWLNYQNFAKWFYNNFYEIENETMCLDKDLLSGDNKIYSHNTCCFLPQSINKVLVGAKGYYFHKPTGKYQAQIKYKGKVINLGYFLTEKEAKQTYKLNKQLIVYLLAEEYKDKLPTKVYNALMNYQMDI
ncbi:MAG: hypothetical protein SOZ04_06040 [Bacilli bacterium]|nr:hypothetical protein [Bacilli bacterium]